LFGSLAGNDLAEGGIVEHALAFAELATVRIYPVRFRNDPPCIVSMRIILVSCHTSSSLSQGEPGGERQIMARRDELSRAPVK
jgi:hypothetical protein